MKHPLAMAALVAGIGACAVPSANAQSMDDKWQFQAIIYGYFPDIGGITKFPERTGGSSVDIGIDTILENLKFVFMGTLEARKGRWGAFTDVIYMDVGGSKSNTRDVSVGGHPLPIGVTTNVDLDLKGTVWTLAGTYRAVSDPGVIVDVLGGARLLDLKETLSYNFSGDVGPIVGPGRSGSSNADASYWDGIVGAKGRVMFGAGRQWFVPYYADVGTGQSDLTWQVFGGLGYAFKWGSVVGGWRYLDYKFKSSSNVEDLNFNGPMVGVAFSW